MIIPVGIRSLPSGDMPSWSLTRNGGTVSSASSGGKIITSSGKMAGMALVGDQ
jgi:hypothetical protein